MLCRHTLSDRVKGSEKFSPAATGYVDEPSSPTCEWSVRDRGVVEEPRRLDSVHPPALDAHCHSALLTYNHVWREDDSGHIQRLQFLWVRGGERTEINESATEKGRGGGLREQLLCNNYKVGCQYFRQHFIPGNAFLTTSWSDCSWNPLCLGG